eukprot:6214635-Pleurochrysis_carterae.AAC.2
MTCTCRFKTSISKGRGLIQPACRTAFLQYMIISGGLYSFSAMKRLRANACRLIVRIRLFC